MSDTITEPIITVTDQALAKILELRAAEDDPDGLGLRIEVTGVRGADFTYDLSFEPLDERGRGRRRAGPERAARRRARRQRRQPAGRDARPAVERRSGRPRAAQPQPAVDPAASATRSS